MIAGSLPGAIRFGPGGELRVPMSVAVIGGLIVSTALTLFVVPCFYSVSDQVLEAMKARVRARHARRTSAKLAQPLHGK
jgi:Cu/Ag efflux pump CusA